MKKNKNKDQPPRNVFPTTNPKPLETFARKSAQRGKVILVVGMSMIVGSFFVSTRWPMLTFILFPLGLFLIGGQIILRHIFFPCCTACRKALDYQFGKFCPRCGQVLKRGELPMDSTCPACHAQHSNDHGRNYTIHHCTHCGIRLTDTGI